MFCIFWMKPLFGPTQASCHYKLPELGLLLLDVFCNGIRILACCVVEADFSQRCLNTLGFPSITLLNLWQTLPIFA